MERGGYVYIVSNKSRSVLYIGVTSRLYNRITDHKSGHGSQFTSRYRCTDLLYFEFLPDIVSAIHREKQLKKWKREYKDRLIKEFNPEMIDLYDQILDHN